MSFVQDPSTATAANVKPSSIAPVVTDAALVVSISPNTPTLPVSMAAVPTGGATSALQTTEIGVLNTIATNTGAQATDFIQTGTITVVNGNVEVTGQGVYTVSASITGTWVGTLVFEGQLADNNWVAIPGYLVTGTLPYQPQFSTTVNGVFLITGGGYQNVRVRASAYTSGTVDVGLDGSLAQQTNFVGQLGSWLVSVTGQAANGAAVSGNPVLVAGSDGTDVRTLATTPVANGIQALQTINAENERPTYSAGVSNLAIVTGATDVLTLTGSATKTIRITRIRFSCLATTDVTIPVTLTKHSTANTGGTSTAPVAVPHDSNDSAATAVVAAYTANPTLGTVVGSFIRSDKLVLQLTAGTTPENVIDWVFGSKGSKSPTLRGTTQQIAINLGATAIAGGSANISIEWTEDSN
jgi:hypothetical protein